MTPEQVRERLSHAERLGYRFTTRHQPAVELEEPDWLVVVHTPDGRRLFPAAMDDEEEQALRRAADLAEADLALEGPPHG